MASAHQGQLDQYAALFSDEGLVIKKAIFFTNVGRLISVK